MESLVNMIKVDDDKIQQDIFFSIHHFPEREFLDLSLLVKDGRVFLSGKIQSKKKLKKLISEIKKISGVFEVLDDAVLIKKQNKPNRLRGKFDDLGLT